MSKIAPAALRDLTDWVVDTRVKAAQLMYWLVLYSERNTSQHAELLINGLTKAANDEDKRILESVGVCIFCLAKTSLTHPLQYCTTSLSKRSLIIFGACMHAIEIGVCL